MMENANEAVENFIHYITQYPYLYDKREAQFKNTQLKTKVWGQIGEAFGITGDEADKYFKSLREKYVRVKRKKALCERSGTGACDDEKWPLFKLLMFLDEVIRQRK